MSRYHVVPHVVGYSSLLSNMTLPTVQGSNVTITVVGGNVFVNNVKVLVPNILTNNGVVHVIESYVYPFFSFELCKQGINVLSIVS